MHVEVGDRLRAVMEEAVQARLDLHGLGCELLQAEVGELARRGGVPQPHQHPLDGQRHARGRAARVEVGGLELRHLVGGEHLEPVVEPAEAVVDGVHLGEADVARDVRGVDVPHEAQRARPREEGLGVHGKEVQRAAGVLGVEVLRLEAAVAVPRVEHEEERHRRTEQVHAPEIGVLVVLGAGDVEDEARDDEAEEAQEEQGVGHDVRHHGAVEGEDGAPPLVVLKAAHLLAALVHP
mmetsp:Transcript_9918/g.29172  ORF Transcript_9918/g.29172 Transcript_9918/m.29172 type:complete len:237 (+) Transcript_9918:388-1098(+)